jgi:DNA-binding GntR family transcriptional regulator
VLPDSSPQTEEEPRSAIVARSLRSRILTGRILPGTRLKDLPLSDEFGVSRNTVREALGLLTTEGLAVYRRNAGCSVRILTAEDARDIYRVRRALETAGAAASVGADLTGLIRHRAAAQDAYDTDDGSALSTANLLFHRQIVGFLGSPRLNDFFFTVMAQLRLVFAVMPDETVHQRAWFSRDMEIVDLLLAGRPDRAHHALIRYLDDSEAEIVDTVLTVGSPGSTGSA